MEDFHIVNQLLGFTLLGAEWILWVLLGLSVLSIAITCERAFYFFRTRVRFATFRQTLAHLLEKKAFDEASTFCEQSRSLEATIALEGIRQRTRTESSQLQSMESLIVSERQKLDRGLVVLGTLGNNAPFIGLFGTVIGIIKSFHDLAQNPIGGPSVVMSGLSEALVATAVGLLVAIPAVIAFNAFNRFVKKRVAHAHAISKLVTALSNHQNS